jgi:hypothetical protein
MTHPAALVAKVPNTITPTNGPGRLAFRLLLKTRPTALESLKSAFLLVCPISKASRLLDLYTPTTKRLKVIFLVFFKLSKLFPIGIDWSCFYYPAPILEAMVR